MRRLGISLYPDKSELIEDQAYVMMAKKLGYTKVFMSFLQIDIQNPQRSIKRIKESARMVKDFGFILTLDIHPMVFQYLPCKEEDLSYFHEMGVDILRLDKGYDGQKEAMMTQNPYGISIEINMSNQGHQLDRILDFLPDTTKLCGSHNFYPQQYTGLDRSYFISCSEMFAKHHLRSAAFITSQTASLSPWPVSEGLCTLEEHRFLPLRVQAQHMKMLQVIDDIFIGNAYASEEELRAVKEVYEQRVDCLHVKVNDDASELEQELLFQGLQEYRGDASNYMIRSSKSRMKYHQHALPAHKEIKEIHRGDVLVLNEDYGQYKAEVQLALCDRNKDPRINVVGHVCEEEIVLLKALRPFQKFQLKKEETR